MAVLVLFLVKVLPLNIHYCLAQFVSNILHFFMGQAYQAPFQDASQTPESVHYVVIFWQNSLSLYPSPAVASTDSLSKINVDYVTYTSN